MKVPAQPNFFEKRKKQNLENHEKPKRKLKQIFTSINKLSFQRNSSQRSTGPATQSTAYLMYGLNDKCCTGGGAIFGCCCC
jgi:hypothetical protein